MNRIHPTAVIEGDVRMGSGNVVGAFAVLIGPLTMGDDNVVGAHAVLGADPEIRGGTERGGLRIGDRNVLREAIQIHRGSAGDTVVGDDCYLMNQVYVAHDCVLGDGVTAASGARLAGHVVVGDKANLGLGVVVHQRRHVGAGAMIGMGAVVTRDVVGFSKTYGNPARPRGVNRVGLERMGASPEVVAAVERLFAESDLVGVTRELAAAGLA